MPTGSDFSRVNLGSGDSSYKQNDQQSISGEYGQVTGQTLPEFGSDLVPPPGNNPRQLSSDVNGDPKALLASVNPSVRRHADINMSYGLCQSEATLGSHPWLRDSLATPGEDEPGNAQPSKGQKTPEFSGA